MEKEIYDGPVTFGDTKLIQMLTRKKEKNIETCSVSINVSKLMKCGVTHSAAVDLIKKLLELKK